MSKSRNAVCDTRCQNFHREMAKKTEKLKTLWFIKNRQRLYDNLAKDGMSQKHRLPSQSKQKIESIKESRPPVCDQCVKTVPIVTHESYTLFSNAGRAATFTPLATARGGGRF
ncbi:unnamed protein product [Trichogramma brassicae]|uniref:Uncharacterized protein n=1 Tax=Trichogramma brassicae TaxID=86971 RepID=A0A6H5I689_9HYME|nr:unnamed protein product [Trichogramma brassicae]